MIILHSVLPDSIGKALTAVGPCKPFIVMLSALVHEQIDSVQMSGAMLLGDQNETDSRQYSEDYSHGDVKSI